MATKGKQQTGAGIPKIPDSIRNPAIFPFRSVPRDSGGRPSRGGHQRPTPDAAALNARNRRRRGGDKRNEKTGPGIPKITDRGLNSAILPIRSVPWGSGRRSAGVGINAQRQTRGHCHPANERAIGRMRDRNPTKKPGGAKERSTNNISHTLYRIKHCTIFAPYRF